MSAEELLTRVRKKNPQISQATIYRTLRVFQNADLVKAHHFNDQEAVYEINRGPQGHHDHLICDSCQRIVEFKNSQIESLQEKIAQEEGFRLIRHRMELYGICQKCELFNSV